MRQETAQLALKHAPRIPREQLLSAVQDLAETDSRLKSGTAAPRAVLEFLIARLTSQRSDNVPVNAAPRAVFANR
jgi:DNA polymerase III delta subunit